jgi:hypothetical protein
MQLRLKQPVLGISYVGKTAELQRSGFDVPAPGDSHFVTLGAAESMAR